ncbi:MAG TPA: hypothetical protein ACHBX0_13755 [Arsenophonus sp.]
MIRDKQIPTDKLISHTFNFPDYLQAFRTVGCDINGKTMVLLEAPNCKILLRLSHIN